MSDIDGELEPPLDISEFRCTTVKPGSVAVVFAQTNRRYVYNWLGPRRGLSEPDIQGSCGVHPAEVLDCLARAVAHKTARDAFASEPVAAPNPLRSRAVQIRNFLTLRSFGEGRPPLSRS